MFSRFEQQVHPLLKASKPLIFWLSPRYLSWFQSHAKSRGILLFVLEMWRKRVKKMEMLFIRKSFPKNSVFGNWNELSSIAGKWKYCPIYWKWILVDSAKQRTFLYNRRSLKLPNMAPWWGWQCVYKVTFPIGCFDLVSSMPSARKFSAAVHRPLLNVHW